MKVLVPIDVQSKRGIDESINAILDNAWPEDAEFYIFNVIEDGPAGLPCQEPGCERHCQCLHNRVHILSDVMRKLETKLPRNTKIFMEVVRGNLRDQVDAWLSAQPDSQLLLTRPLPDKRDKKIWKGILTSISLGFIAAGVAFALATFNPAPAGGFVPVMPLVPVKPPAAITTPTTVKPTPVPAQRASADELKMEVLSRLGDSDVDAEDWWRAVLNYRQALMYGQRAHASQAKLCSINSGLSIAYAGLRQFAKAIEYGKQSLNAALAENPKDMIDISIAYNNLGYLHRATKDFKSAQRYYEQALKTAPTASWEARIRAATIESNLSELYALTNQPQKALNGYRHALRVFQTEMPKNTELIREIKRRIELIELRRPLAMSKYPISVVIVKANI